MLAALLYYGELCRGCGHECKEKGQFAIQCPSCSGYGCDKCSDGELILDGCPNEMCGGMRPTIEAINLFHEGLPPITGGSLDQSSTFIEAARFYKHATSRVESDIKCRANQ